MAGETSDSAEFSPSTLELFFGDLPTFPWTLSRHAGSNERVTRTGIEYERVRPIEADCNSVADIEELGCRRHRAQDVPIAGELVENVGAKDLAGVNLRSQPVCILCPLFSCHR
jgi:hypothetical protein